MAELIAEEGALKGLTLSFAEGTSWLVGRDPDECDLILEDSKVSRKHLLCTLTEEGGILLENLSHSNPTKVNDRQALEPLLLHNGDKVQIGATLFRFFSDKPDVVPPRNEEPPFEETIFKEEEVQEIPPVNFSLEPGRFLLKVVAGPNAGAELNLEAERDYLIGTDTATCDIVFHDLSVSRNHARVRVDSNGMLAIEDLGSRNGVVVGKERILGRALLAPNTLVTVGTSVFLVIDKEAPLATIAAPLEEERAEPSSFDAPTPSLEEPAVESAALEKKPFRKGVFLLALLCSLFVILLGVGMISLFRSHDVKPKTLNAHNEIQKALAPFPQVKFTFNAPCNRLFLIGHVSSGLQKSEMLYTLKALPFIQGIDDHVVDDEAVWQEMNILLSKMPAFEGVSMHAPEAGKFVLTGYLKTSAQASALTDYMNLNFNYLDRLENCVVVEEEILDEVQGLLQQQGFNGVGVEYSNGQLILTGYIPSNNAEVYHDLVEKFAVITGVRQVRNYVVSLTPEQAIVDLNERFPGKYRVTGYSKHGNINVNVVINGCILMRGDTLDSMTITSIQAHTIFLEKEGLKYKIEYNIRECKPC